MTEKLYYIDSHIFEFDAQVLECREEKKGFGIILDRTAFFPEGGGQPADTGFIGSVRVRDVREKDEILHFTDAPLAVGETVHCFIDAEQRRRRMQNHSGEHIVSGLCNRLHGLENVGFHMGADCMTIDLSGELTWDELMEIERLANETVRADLPVRTWFPDERELAEKEYRSKLELTENVRLVEIPGVDCCACCAPHVERTGEVGIIKILDSQRHRGGVRVSLVCGMDALDDYRLRQQSVTEISQALSAKRNEVSAAVRRILAEQQKQKERSDALSAELIALRAAAIAPTEGDIVLFDSVLDEVAQRELVNLLMPKCGRLAAVFCGSGSEGWRYVIGSLSVDLRANARSVNAAINGRGGGSRTMISGRAGGSGESIADGLRLLEL